MHSLAHLVDSIKRRGVTSNCSTDRGEALHPQNKKHWARSNRQASASAQVGHLFSYPTFNLISLFIQMLHMGTESEIIRKIRYQVDYYDEQHGVLPKRKDSNPQQHIQLCSPNTNRTTISAYSVTLQQEHGITDFLESLSLFFERNNQETDVYSYKVGLSLRCGFLHTNEVGHTLLLMPSCL